MKTWDTKKSTFRVSDFISWLRAGTLELSPSFQRRSVWTTRGKSLLIDTIVRGLPVPIIFLRDKRTDLKTLEPRREVVDGQQRLRTIFSYLCPHLLKDFDKTKDPFTVMKSHNIEVANKKFASLSPDLQNRILDYEISVHVLPVQVDDREILQIFSRMNSTGIKLNHQELRNAEFIGEFKTIVYQLASEQLQRWRVWGIFSENNLARMHEVEITSEFALLMIKGLTGKTQKALNNLYHQNDTEFPNSAEIIRRFRHVMDSIEDKLGNEMSSFFGNRTLFYILFAFFYDLHFGICSKLTHLKPKPINTKTVHALLDAGNYIKEKHAPEEVLSSVTRRTTDLHSRKTLLKYLKEQIELGKTCK